jgi:hypothetical protein
MNRVYGFSYETPRQYINNRRQGWDDEDFMEIVVESDTDQEALEWGQTVATELMRILYESCNESIQYRWNPIDYVNELISTHNYTPDQIAQVPQVRYGEHLNYEQVLAGDRFEDAMPIKLS